MFRGKESSKRIELSRLVQELLNFGVFGSLRLLRVVGLWMGVGVDGWGLGVVWGCLNTCAHACACMHAHACAHACMVNMIISCKWLPPLGKSLGIPYDVICMHVCMYMCVHVCWGHPLTTPTHIHPQGGPLESVKIQ